MSLSLFPHEIESLIRQIQNRLGTSEERPGDVEQIVHLCHHWANLRQMEISSAFKDKSKSGSFIEGLRS